MVLRFGNSDKLIHVQAKRSSTLGFFQLSFFFFYHKTTRSRKPLTGVFSDLIVQEKVICSLQAANKGMAKEGKRTDYQPIIFIFLNFLSRNISSLGENVL